MSYFTNYDNHQYGDYYSQVGAMGSMQASGLSASHGSGGADEQLSTGILAAFGTSGYPDEPSLLEELGVNFGHIIQKTKVVLHPLGHSTVSVELMEDSDLAGPILFFLLFGTFLLLSGKSHFGYIYGLGLMGTFTQYSVLNLMAKRHIDFMKTMSVLGYCLLPIVAMAAAGVFLSLTNAIGYTLGALAIAWCAYSSSAMFTAYLQLSHVRVLVAYPLVLFYSAFSLLTLFQKAVASAPAPIPVPVPSAAL